MGFKGKITEDFVASILKWVIVILFAGVILYLVTPKYEFIKEDSCFNKVTGRLHVIKS